MDEWKPGDPEDWGDHVGVPDIAYMGYINNGYDNERPSYGTYSNKADILGKEAWNKYMDCKDMEALDLINRALSYNNSHANNWNTKAIILQELKRYAESDDCYKKSLRLRKSKIVIENRARMLKKWSMKLSDEKNYNKALNIINEAIDELSKIQTEENLESYESHKRNIIFLRDYTRKCEEQERVLKNIGKEKLITLTGTKYYEEFEKVNIGSLLRLVKEPENEQDPNAIAVYFKEEKIGYVANSDYTASDLTLKASELQDIGENTYAEYLMHYEKGYFILKIKGDLNG